MKAIRFNDDMVYRALVALESRATERGHGEWPGADIYEVAGRLFGSAEDVFRPGVLEGITESLERLYTAGRVDRETREAVAVAGGKMPIPTGGYRYRVTK